jgi:hypothetical protein
MRLFRLTAVCASLPPPPYLSMPPRRQMTLHDGVEAVRLCEGGLSCRHELHASELRLHMSVRCPVTTAFPDVHSSGARLAPSRLLVIRRECDVADGSKAA